MPLIDVSELMTDPDFCDDSIVVFRKSQNVNDYGVVDPTIAQQTITGVVTQGVGDQMYRSLDYEILAGSITVHTKFELSAGDGNELLADEIEWGGRRYVVKNLSDWSTFGEGFTSAECVLKRRPT